MPITTRPADLHVIGRGRYDARGYSNEESIANLQLVQPEDISTVLTYNFGKDDDRFPLTFLTEGQGQVGTRDITKTEWRWPVMGRQTFNDFVSHFGNDESGVLPSGIGRGGKPFTLHFKTHKIIEQYGLLAPDNVTAVRVMKDLGQTQWGYGYVLQLTNPDPNREVDPELLAHNKSWTMTAPTVTESYSKGNRSNTYGPGKMRNQLQFNRFSKEIGGNISNAVVQYQFVQQNGSKTNLWINEEMRQFEILQRTMMEEELWFSEYNRNVNGEIVLKDFYNGKPIPHTTGMFEVCRENNYDTYGENLPLQKIIHTVGDVLSKDTDTGNMNVMILGGKGFLDDFHEGILADARHNNFIVALGEAWIKENNGKNGGLTYGNRFKHFETTDGHVISTGHLGFLDYGSTAENDRANGYLHPRTHLPMSSHQGVAIDFSTYEGQQNVQMVRLEGQVDLTGILKGLTPIPASWGGAHIGNSIASEIDHSRYEKKTSRGVQVYNARRCFMLKCVM
jgi:hypothetical protein